MVNSSATLRFRLRIVWGSGQVETTLIGVICLNRTSGDTERPSAETASITVTLAVSGDLTLLFFVRAVPMTL